MYKIIVEYKTGEIKEYIMNFNLWIDILYQAIETNENIEHYTIDKIK